MTHPAHRRALQGLGLALLLALSPSLVAAAKEPLPVPVADRPTSRMVVEKQLRAQSPVAAARMTSPEARRVEERYLSRIGVQLEVRDTSQSGHGN